MKIEFLGHASFLITTDDGIRILTDPCDGSEYPDPSLLAYDIFDEDVDIITVSHSHPDHSATRNIKNKRAVVQECSEFSYAGVSITGVQTFHDEVQGEKRGNNTVFVIEADGVRVAHLGDLGHVPTTAQCEQIGAVDVVLIPVGGYYTIDSLQAHVVAQLLKARIVIPMHYKTAKCNFPIDTVDRFIDGRENVSIKGSPTLVVTPETLPDKQRIVVLDYSH